MAGGIAACTPSLRVRCIRWGAASWWQASAAVLDHPTVGGMDDGRHGRCALGATGRWGTHRRPRVGGRVTGRLDERIPKMLSPSLGRPPPAAAGGRVKGWWGWVVRRLAFQSWLRRRGVGGGTSRCLRFP
jgi:hypothetical protein